MTQPKEPQCLCAEINARHCPIHNEPQEPLKPKDFFNSEWFKDGTKKLCADGWPTFVVPLNIMVNKMLEENQALQSKLEKAEAENKRLTDALKFVEFRVGFSFGGLTEAENIIRKARQALKGEEE